MDPNTPIIRSDLLFDELTDGVCIADMNGEILYMNPAARRLLGFEGTMEKPNSCRLLCGKLFGPGSDDFAKVCPLRESKSHRESVSFRGKHGPHDVWEWKDEAIRHVNLWRNLRVRCLKVSNPRRPPLVQEHRFILIEDVSVSTEISDTSDVKEKRP